jgi:hypothetical protein
MMNDHPRQTELEEEIARTAALSYIPARPHASQAVAEAKTLAHLADDAASAIANLLIATNQADAAIEQVAQAATALSDKAALARKLIVAVRDSAQK